MPKATGGFVQVDGEPFYRISGYHRMPPFLMSLPSDTDLWMFISSTGGLTTGRVDAEGSLFPYETVDRLHDGHHHTGPITLVRVRRAAREEVLWQPFSRHSDESPRIERNLYKNTIGNRLIFEEIHHDLEMAFRYGWSASDAFGQVRTATLHNLGATPVSASLLDGLRNIIPFGAAVGMYQAASCLVDAYKRTEYDPATRLAIYSLTSKIVDRAEAAEELRANAVWCHGIEGGVIGLAIETVEAFRRGEPIATELRLNGRRGNYFVVAELALPPGASNRWHLVADAGRSQPQLAALRRRLLSGKKLGEEIEASLSEAGDNLRRMVASADGLQLTGHDESAVHHFANVLFNNMRGGVFAQNNTIPLDDFQDFVQRRNRDVAARQAAFLAGLPATLTVAKLLYQSERTHDADLERLAHEYLPLYFGRRHGDPSRPWNRFAIHVRNADGSRALRYEGNWRDIFQNWEALCVSFPGFLPGVISRFVNASTVDGFNPYRITRDGIDWEVIDPHNPWSHIGYWGDHQVIYLLKFLEALARFSPGALEGMLDREIFAYANVPYRLNSYRAILADPHVTIEFDSKLAAQIYEYVARLGGDGRLLSDPDGGVYHANLLEKLLVPLLSKLSNFVPGGGIWMNTQRPEWNDANNALAGNGVSVVTLCYLRRYLCFLQRQLQNRSDSTALVSIEVANWLRQLHAILLKHGHLAEATDLADTDRKQMLDALGEAFSDYRQQVYAAGFSGKTPLPVAEIQSLGREALRFVDQAIRANRRPDGLYHAYLILEISPDGDAARLGHLPEMLEGQVAVLSSGVIGAAEALRIVAGLFAGPLHRADQHSFLLYPEKTLPGFMERNIIPDEQLRGVPLLGQLLAAGDESVVAREVTGIHRFNADFRNARDLDAALEHLARRTEWTAPVARDRQAVLDLFESVFAHRSFTGRSSAMYGYEGLGCIYWHMVAKLLLAVQEIHQRAVREAEPAAILDELAFAYHRIRSGLGFEKSVAEYGAYPTDPYSHTPPHAGAQQPGMTGQVKEEILTRFGELGVEVEAGVVSFRPHLLRPIEFRREPGVFRTYDLAGTSLSIDVPGGALAFSFGQVPILYELTTGEPWIRVTAAGGTTSTLPGHRLDEDQSQALFQRDGTIARINVGIPDDWLCRH